VKRKKLRHDAGALRRAVGSHLLVLLSAVLAPQSGCGGVAVDHRGSGGTTSIGDGSPVRGGGGGASGSSSGSDGRMLDSGAPGNADAPACTPVSQHAEQLSGGQCRYAMPLPPRGQKIDPNKIDITYTDTSGHSIPLPHVTDKAACSLAMDAWYFDDPISPMALVLCTDTCIKTMTSGALEIDARTEGCGCGLCH
jgi:hypothetical protein